MLHWQTFHLCCYQELSPQPPTLWTATTGGRSNSELDWEKESQEPQHFKRIVLQDAVFMKDKEHTINILISADRHQEAPCFDFAASAIQVHHNFFFPFYSIFATISSWSHSAIPFCHCFLLSTYSATLTFPLFLNFPSSLISSHGQGSLPFSNFIDKRCRSCILQHWLLPFPVYPRDAD